jgi:predicted AAA+ superfamily ATPase
MHPEYQLDALKELVSSYLFKDVLAFAGIRKSEMLEILLKSLAWQVGQEVSYSELSSHLGIDVKTISYYIDILEKSYVIFRLPAFSKHVRNEIKTNKKIYFYDNGVRNALIGNYDPILLRNDRGALWENFLISERKKQLVYQKSQVQSYFWRTKQQQEIDYVETDYQSIKAFEIKWNAAKQIRFPKTFSQAYDASEMGIHRQNFRDFLQIK